MHRHMKTCKYKGTVVKKDDKDARIEKLEKQVEALMELKGGGNTIINNVNHNHNHIENQQINIQINGFLDEKIEYITDNHELLKSLLNGPMSGVPKLLEQIHFHPDHPENWNVKITNDKKPHAEIFDSKKNKWIKRDKKETITDMVERSYGVLDAHYDKFKKEDCLESKVLKKFQKFSNKYDEGDKSLHKGLEKSTKILILNGVYTI